MKCFGTMRQKIIDAKSWCPAFSLFLNVSRYQKFLKHSRVPLRNLSSVVWDKNYSTKNHETPSPLSSIKFFDTNFFLNHITVPSRRFSVLWDGKFSTELGDTRWPLSSLTYFRTTSLLKHRRVLLRIVLELWTNELSVENSDNSPSYPWKFAIPDSFWNT